MYLIGSNTAETHFCQFKGPKCYGTYRRQSYSSSALAAWWLWICYDDKGYYDWARCVCTLTSQVCFTEQVTTTSCWALFEDRWKEWKALPCLWNVQNISYIECFSSGLPVSNRLPVSSSNRCHPIRPNKSFPALTFDSLPLLARHTPKNQYINHSSQPWHVHWVCTVWYEPIYCFETRWRELDTGNEELEKTGCSRCRGGWRLMTVLLYRSFCCNTMFLCAPVMTRNGNDASKLPKIIILGQNPVSGQI